MAKVEIDRYGTKRYYNDDGELHREDGPAVIYSNGIKSFFVFGISINSEKLELPDTGALGDMVWYNKHGDFHRSNGPADDYPNGNKRWYTNGDQAWPKLK